jgi:hypothetical protein
MNPSVNRSSDSPHSSGETTPEVNSVQSQHPETPTGDSQTAINLAAKADSTEIMPLDVKRQQPIPPPSEPTQYRAIGLIRGKYMPSIEQLTRGTLLADDGTLIDSVLLGRVMSLVKNHLDLDQSHLWVVYPRSRQEDGNLHVQIVGVWEPEKLNRADSTESPDTDEVSEQPEAEVSSDLLESEAFPDLQDGYFSIRGEVIYQSREEEQVIVKIRQSPRKEADKIKFFKLKLKGFLGDKVVGHFWDFHIQLHGNDLTIQEANDICLMPAKKRPPYKGGMGKKKPFAKKRGDFKKPPSNQRPMRKGEPAVTQAPPKRRDPLPKPVKRGEQRGGGAPSGNSS